MPLPPRPSPVSLWPSEDREAVLKAVKGSEDRITRRLETLESEVHNIAKRDIVQEDRLHALELARASGSRTGLTLGAAGSGAIALLLWFLQQIQAGNVPGLKP